MGLPLQFPLSKYLLADLGLNLIEQLLDRDVVVMMYRYLNDPF